MGAASPKDSWLYSRKYHVARVALFAVASVLIVVALFMLSFTTAQLTRSQQVAADLVQSEQRAEVLLIASFDDGDPATQKQRDGVIDLLNRSQVAVDVEYLDAHACNTSANVPGATLGTAGSGATTAATTETTTEGNVASLNIISDDASDVAANDQAAAASGAAANAASTSNDAAAAAANDQAAAASGAAAFASSAAGSGVPAHGDTTAYGQALANTTWGQAIAKKIADHGNYSAVVCIDDDALCFIQATHDSLFAQTPVVFLGVNDATTAQHAYNLGYATGVLEMCDAAGMLRTAQSMRPDAHNVIVVTDNTATGIGDRAQFQQALAEADDLASLSTTYLNASSMSRSDLANRLSDATDQDIVIYLDATADSAGTSYSASQTAYYLSDAVSQPVFAIGFGGVGEGFAASSFVDYEREGQRAGEIVVAVLNGTRPADIPVETFASEGSVFDSEVLNASGISLSLLPADASVLHQSGLSGDSLRPIFLPIVLLVLGVLCIIAFAILGYRRTALDMAEIVTQRNMLERRFYTDHLTEMPNMQWLTAYAGSEASSKVRSIVEVALLDLGQIDATRGAGTANEVVKVMASRLNGLDKNFLVRSDHNEFILGIDRELEPGGALLTRLDRLLHQPITVDDDAVTVKPCIGVYNRERGMSIEEMVAGVDLAIHQAEQLGMTGDVFFYDADMRTAVEHKLEVTSQVKRAIDKDNLIVVYQPQIELATNEVIGYEALVRLRGDRFMPDQFIPIAEVNGQIVDIDRIVTRKVIQQLATWKKRKQRIRPVSINYSYGQLRDDHYLDYTTKLLDEYTVPHSLLRMDIREDIFISSMAKAARFVEELREAGFGIAIDGFGAGHTSISRIVEVPADAVKIDRTLTQAFLAGKDDGVIENLVAMVHSAGKIVVIEGIETADQLHKCREMGCDVVQGFYFSEPLLPEQAVRYRPNPADTPAPTPTTPAEDPTAEPERESGLPSTGSAGLDALFEPTSNND